MGKTSGGGGTDIQSASNPAADRLAEIADQLFKQTDPLRQDLIGQAGDFLSGDRDVTGLPAFQASKGTLESQFGRARDSIIGNTATGGQLTDQLAQLERGRATDLTNLEAGLGESELARAVALATGGATTGVGGLGAAGGIQSQMAQALAAQNAGKAGGLGAAAGGLGAFLGSK